MKRNVLLGIARKAVRQFNKTKYMITNYDYCSNDVNQHLDRNNHPKTNRSLLEKKKGLLNQLRNKDNNPAYSPASLGYVATQALRTEAGQCYETAAVIFKYICENEAGREIVVEIFNNPAQDHNFVVLNRAKDSDPSQPKTWGNECLVVDRWADNICFVSDYLAEEVNCLALSASYGEKSGDFITGVSDEGDTYGCVVEVPCRTLKQQVNLSDIKNSQDLANYFSQKKPVLNDNIPSTLMKDTQGRNIIPDINTNKTHYKRSCQYLYKNMARETKEKYANSFAKKNLKADGNKKPTKKEIRAYKNKLEKNENLQKKFKNYCLTHLLRKKSIIKFKTQETQLLLEHKKTEQNKPNATQGFFNPKSKVSIATVFDLSLKNLNRDVQSVENKYYNRLKELSNEQLEYMDKLLGRKVREAGCTPEDNEIEEILKIVEVGIHIPQPGSRIS